MSTINSTPPRKFDIFHDYQAFVDKFNTPKTTDDCYTPPEIYDTVINWVHSSLLPLDGKRIRRPFKPGGDYQAEAATYSEGDIVIDNPPFSILAQIVTFYQEHGIPFFLFAPTLTLFGSPRPGVTYIVSNATVTYANGAKVNTSFITNIEGIHRVIVAGDLCKLIEATDARIRKAQVKTQRTITYPEHLITAALLGKIAKRGVTFKVPMSEATFVRKLDNGSGSIFGGGYLLSERMAAERMAAERMAAERMAAERITLSEREREIVRSMAKA